jgi:tRNA pseudouridine55 synthase
MARRKRRGRNVSGVLLLDKPGGITSNEALQKVKTLFFAAKAGHTGALDPLATGMLPICFGEATKFSQYLLDSDKGYQVRAKLGIRTDSADSDGQVIATRDVNVSQRDIEKALQQFRGDIMQVPSMFSALKHQGQPLYKLARQGKYVEREARPVTVYRCELVQFNGDEIELEIECSKGTYVRNIIDDLGERLGCGAHVISLRRNFVAEYPPQAMVTIEQLEADRATGNSLDGHLLPVDSPVMALSEVELDFASAGYFCHGQAIFMPDLVEGEDYRVYDENGQFLGVAQMSDDGMLQPRRLVTITG